MTKDAVDQHGARLHLQEEDTLRELWDDCTEEQRAMVSRVHGGQISEAEAPDGRLVSSLVERGLLRIDGTRLQVGCGALRGFLDQGAGCVANVLATLFASPEAFTANTKGLLQLRFAALPEIDVELADYLRNSIENVDKPKVLIRMIRALIERCFELIWDRTIPDRRIPPEWTAAWKLPDRDGNVVMNPPEGNVPRRLGLQCRLLDLMTDPRKDRHTTVRRSTYALLNGLQPVGDFGQHLEGEIVPHGFGVAVCLTALQMAQQLHEELTG